MASGDETIGTDHGHTETRVTVMHDGAGLEQGNDWPGLAGVVIVESALDVGARTGHETSDYITSVPCYTLIETLNRWKLLWDAANAHLREKLNAAHFGL